MKKLMMLAALTSALLLTGSAHMAVAADNTIRPILGFNQSAIDLGVDYEKRVSHDMGWGAYFFYGAEDKPTVHQVTALGAMAPIYLLDNGSLDAYVAPGFGLAMVKGIGTESDETTVGPSFKLGAEWRFSPTLKGGVQYFEVYNWFTDKTAPSSMKYASASLAIAF